jgi:hypothetical protein
VVEVIEELGHSHLLEKRDLLDFRMTSSDFRHLTLDHTEQIRVIACEHQITGRPIIGFLRREHSRVGG